MDVVLVKKVRPPRTQPPRMPARKKPQAKGHLLPRNAECFICHKFVKESCLEEHVQTCLEAHTTKDVSKGKGVANADESQDNNGGQQVQTSLDADQCTPNTQSDQASAVQDSRIPAEQPLCLSPKLPSKTTMSFFDNFKFGGPSSGSLATASGRPQPAMASAKQKSFGACKLPGPKVAAKLQSSETDHPHTTSPQCSEAVLHSDSMQEDSNPPETLEVGHWLTSIGLGGYFKVFVEKGYDTLRVCAALDVQDLDALEVTLPGSRKKLLVAASDLQKDLDQHRDTGTLLPFLQSKPLDATPVGVSHNVEEVISPSVVEGAALKRPSTPPKRTPGREKQPRLERPKRRPLLDARNDSQFARQAQEALQRKLTLDDAADSSKPLECPLPSAGRTAQELKTRVLQCLTPEKSTADEEEPRKRLSDVSSEVFSFFCKSKVGLKYQGNAAGLATASSVTSTALQTTSLWACAASSCQPAPCVAEKAARTMEQDVESPLPEGTSAVPAPLPSCTSMIIDLEEEDEVDAIPLPNTTPDARQQCDESSTPTDGSVEDKAVDAASADAFSVEPIPEETNLDHIQLDHGQKVTGMDHEDAPQCALSTSPGSASPISGTSLSRNSTPVLKSMTQSVAGTSLLKYAINPSESSSSSSSSSACRSESMGNPSSTNACIPPSLHSITPRQLNFGCPMADGSGDPNRQTCENAPGECGTASQPTAEVTQDATGPGFNLPSGGCSISLRHTSTLHEKPLEPPAAHVAPSSNVELEFWQEVLNVREDCWKIYFLKKEEMTATIQGALAKLDAVREELLELQNQSLEQICEHYSVDHQLVDPLRTAELPALTASLCSFPIDTEVIPWAKLQALQATIRREPNPGCEGDTVAPMEDTHTTVDPTGVHQLCQPSPEAFPASRNITSPGTPGPSATHSDDGSEESEQLFPADIPRDSDEDLPASAMVEEGSPLHSPASQRSDDFYDCANDPIPLSHVDELLVADDVFPGQIVTAADNPTTGCIMELDNCSDYHDTQQSADVLMSLHESQVNKREFRPINDNAQQRITRKNDAATSHSDIMPDYNTMSLPELKRLVAIYGVKPKSRDFMVAKLTQIWTMQHGAAMAPNTIVSSGHVPSKVLMEAVERPRSTEPTQLSQHTQSDIKKAALHQEIINAIKQCPAPATTTASHDNGCQDVHELRRRYFSTRSLYERILLGETIDRDEVLMALQERNVRCPKVRLEEFLTEQSVSWKRAWKPKSKD